MELLYGTWLWSFVLVATAGVLIWFAAGFWLWLLIAAPALAGFTVMADAGTLSKTFVWLTYLTGMAIFGVPWVRARVISASMARLMRQEMPTVSLSEQEALEGSGTGWETELFSGRPAWGRFRRIGRSRLTEAERAFLDGPVEQFCRAISDYQINEKDHDLPEAAWKLIRSERFFGLVIPEDYDGLGFSPSAHAAVIMKIASRSMSAALTVMTPNSAGPARLILDFGTQAQKDQYLPRLARGTEIPCLALTGTEAGSDTASITDIGIVCRQNYGNQSDVLGVRINFDKRYITLAPIATLVALAFKLLDPDHLLGEDEKPGITLALVPADSPGVEQGARHDPLHLGFHNGPLRGRDVFVPMDAIIGGHAGVGRGWNMLTTCHTDARAISLPALSCAASKVAARVSGAYARVRYQFRAPIASFEGVQEALAPIAGYTHAMEAARHLILAELDHGRKPAVAAGIVKYNLTGRCRAVLQHAMDIHAGAAICRGPRNIIAEFHEFAPIGVTIEGANILTRSLTTFGQGVLLCHPCLQAEISAACRPGTPDVSGFDRALAKHMRLASRNLLRTVALGLSGARLAGAPARARAPRRHYRQVGRLSAAFALATDVLLLSLRGTIRRRERQSGRMADLLSELYISAAALRWYELSDGDASDRYLLDWVMADSLSRAQRRLEEVCRNLASPLMGRVLRRAIFPFGRPWSQPDDRLERRLADLLTVPSTGRDRLTAGIHVPSGTEDPFAVLEAALGKVSMTAPLSEKLREGARMELIGSGPFEQRLEAAVESRVLSLAEADELRYAEQARQRVLTVDATDPDSPGS